MSMTKYMHPRNIYKIPPNFKQLAIDYPEFRKYAKQELNGKISIDFKDPHALRALTLTLLEKDFGLKIDIPADKLVPTVPLRLNYLLWIEDLISISGLEENHCVRGLDIGTGASCVYPLIAAKNFGWSMIGREVNEGSCENALQNVQKNNLLNLIKVEKVEENSKFFDLTSADFCMCNPPFFGTPKELIFEFKSRKQSRPRPKNAFTGNIGEVVSKGGEIEFVSRIIRESSETKENIRIYTTMVGCKTSLQPLKTLLRSMDHLVSFKQTEFCQGNVTRWGLAWTYCDIDLRRVPEATVAQARKDRSQQMALTWTVGDQCDLGHVTEDVLKILKELQMIIKPIGISKNVRSFQIIAKQNTWSNQRRKRRDQKRRMSDTSDICLNNNELSNTTPLMSEDSPILETTTDTLSSLTVHSPGSSKRASDDSDDEFGFYRHKRQKLSLVDEQEAVILNGDVFVRREGTTVKLEMLYREGTGGKDGIHQVMQYVKNNLIIREEC